MFGKLFPLFEVNGTVVVRFLFVIGCGIFRVQFVFRKNIFGFHEYRFAVFILIFFVAVARVIFFCLKLNEFFRDNKTRELFLVAQYHDGAVGRV